MSSQGKIAAKEKQTLIIKFFPGVPAPFKREIKVKANTCLHKLSSYSCELCIVQIQVAHFEPDVIRLTGTASYPRLSMTVSRPITDTPDPARYGELRHVASQRLATRKKIDTPDFTYVRTY